METNKEIYQKVWDGLDEIGFNRDTGIPLYCMYMVYSQLDLPDTMDEVIDIPEFEKMFDCTVG